MERPLVILKYAKCSNGFIGKRNHQVWLTNQFSKRLTHKWRSEVDGILVGKNTVNIDNPSLTTRFDFGKSPTRIILGKKNEFDKSLKIQNKKSKTIFYQERNLKRLLFNLKKSGIESLMVEGGATILSSFIRDNLWDEARVFTVKNKIFDGIKAPRINLKPVKTHNMLTDQLEIFYSNQ